MMLAKGRELTEHIDLIGKRLLALVEYVVLKADTLEEGVFLEMMWLEVIDKIPNEPDELFCIAVEDAKYMPIREGEVFRVHKSRIVNYTDEEHTIEKVEIELLSIVAQHDMNHN